ncbi:muscle-specific protein 20 isoform X1 [Melanaphis sacchari]|uniref:muscle-specific protein 20 isoform X1 n=1 Tax=Melanaphis sacchari TaxID=742174 RepID=UPI000DC12D0E|nr:muscle-specific protein 20 isoform X1 [Melanaphis sacchari]
MKINFLKLFALSHLTPVQKAHLSYAVRKDIEAKEIERLDRMQRFRRWKLKKLKWLNQRIKNKEQEKEMLEWIGNVLGEAIPNNVSYEDYLKDGVVLCNLINKIAPGSVKKIQTKGSNFQLMENIQRFQAAIKKYGVPEEEIFQTADLFERRNIPQVTLCLYALARITQKHPEYTGPALGPKMAEANKREFTEDQLRASEGHLNLQMGYNKGASQSGLGSFGNSRHM